MKQLSVFLENRAGRLEEALDVLAQEEINILSLSMADTSEYGMLRLLVSNPEKGRAALKERGFSATLTDVLAVKMAHKVGELRRVLKLLYEAGINVEYMYALHTKTDEAAMAIKPSDLGTALTVLQKAGVTFYEADGE